MVFMSSCAYMQTNKNVAEMGCRYEGKLVEMPNCSTWNIYKSGGKWYIAAKKVELKKHYPVIRDTILYTENNEPTYEILPNANQHKVCYHPISEGTAQVLMRTDGYADLGDLAEEIKNTPGDWVDTLSHARSYPIRAHVECPKDMNDRLIAGARTPEKTPFGNQVLSGIELVLIDTPGTILYNVAIPLMAPIKFFSEFTINY